MDYEAGIAIIHNENKVEPVNSAYLTFKSGYQNKTHKHYDDLSITYYNDGHDILVDSGKYSYDMTNPIRDYIISPEAHNTIYIKNKEYILKKL
ncbi:heparinase II/III family protein [Jeotgalicoccus sp. WY2]|uniref:heparinase II/III domain-containing protein n=1 Tax=Jeotgalicoccus sp. WY2 TaxID=2708346 RepID=UPI001BD41BD6|nr:heparinase II/III family protein [Jeotgalicoccus sp. WY2]